MSRVLQEIWRKENNIALATDGQILEVAAQAIRDGKGDFVWKTRTFALWSATLLSESHVFHVQHPVDELLAQTRNRWHDLQLPFDTCYLDLLVDVPGTGRRIGGILVTKPSGRDKLIAGIAPAEDIPDEESRKWEAPEEHWNASMAVFFFNSDKEYEKLQFGTKSVPLPLHQAKRRDPLLKLAELLVLNWHDLVHSPQVKLVELGRGIQTVRPTKGGRIGNLRRPQTRIVLGKELHQHVERMRVGMRSKYGHQFWVRGHWRRLMNERRWKAALGKRIWVPPFVKGEGLLVKKFYDVPEDAINYMVREEPAVTK